MTDFTRRTSSVTLRRYRAISVSIGIDPTGVFSTSMDSSRASSRAEFNSDFWLCRPKAAGVFILYQKENKGLMPRQVIAMFNGDYRFLSNFYPCEIAWDNLEYPSVENAYQARKTSDPHLRFRFTQYGAGAAKRVGRSLILPENWETIKFMHMAELVRQKFTRHRELGRMLLDTGDAALIEGNYWGDTYWGVCNGEGENHLGKILECVRETLR